VSTNGRARCHSLSLSDADAAGAWGLPNLEEEAGVWRRGLSDVFSGRPHYRSRAARGAPNGVIKGIAPPSDKEPSPLSWEESSRKGPFHKSPSSQTIKHRPKRPHNSTNSPNSPYLLLERERRPGGHNNKAKSPQSVTPPTRKRGREGREDRGGKTHLRVMCRICAPASPRRNPAPPMIFPPRRYLWKGAPPSSGESSPFFPSQINCFVSIPSAKRKKELRRRTAENAPWGGDLWRRKGTSQVKAGEFTSSRYLLLPLEGLESARRDGGHVCGVALPPADAKKKGPRNFGPNKSSIWPKLRFTIRPGG